MDRDDKALLLEAAKQYAQAAGAMPLREMSFDLSAGGTFRLSIYEGDKTDELRERVVAAGAGEDEADLILGTALLTLQQERLIPMVVSQVFVRGKEAAVSVFKDDSIAAVVGSFAMKYNLSAEDTALLLEHVQAEAFRHRAVPMLVIPVSMPEVETRLKIYYGDSIRERVATFAEEYGLAEAAKESLLEHATRSAARNSFIPFVSFTPDFTGPQGESLPDLQIWARDNVTRAVQDYADFHLLTDEQERAMLKEAVAKAKAAGVLPLLSLRVGINATEGDTEHLLATFDLFEVRTPVSSSTLSPLQDGTRGKGLSSGNGGRENWLFVRTPKMECEIGKINSATRRGQGVFGKQKIRQVMEISEVA